MREQGPGRRSFSSTSSGTRTDYDAFIFFTYLYTTTYFGLPPVAEKAILVADRARRVAIYFGMWDRLVELPRALVFQTEEELAFMRRRFPRARLDGPILGVAVERLPRRTRIRSARPTASTRPSCSTREGSTVQGVGELPPEFRVVTVRRDGRPPHRVGAGGKGSHGDSGDAGIRG